MALNRALDSEKRSLTHFLLFLSPILLMLPFIFSHHWIPKHDTLQAVMASHVFYSDLVKNHEVLQWSPFTEAGADLGYALNVNAFHASLMALFPLMKVFTNLNFLHVFYLSLILDELILLIGIYFLSKELFKSIYARLFAVFSISGTVIWHSQVYLNFYSYYSLPLCLYFIQKGSRLRTPWRIILAFLITWVAKMFHVAQLIVLVFFLFSCMLRYRYPWSQFKRQGTRKEMAVFGGLVLIGICSIVYLSPLIRPAILSPGRGADGLMPFGEYLKMVSDSNLFHLAGLITGNLDSIDTTSYAGFLTPALAALSLFCFSLRMQLALFLTTGFLFLCYLGPSSFLAPTFYFIKPIALFFRHWGSFSVYLKIFLSLVAAFSVDELVRLSESKKNGRYRKCLVTLAGFLLVSAGALWIHQKHEPQELSYFALQMVLYGVCLVSLFRLYFSRMVARRLIGFVLITLCFVDVMSYRFHTYGAHFKEFSVGRPVWELFKLRAPEFQKSREKDYFNQPSFNLFARVIFASPALTQILFGSLKSGIKDDRIGFSKKIGALYNITESFLGFDPCVSIFRTDFSLPNTHLFFKTLEENPSPDWLNALGCGSSKIQFYNGKVEGTELLELAHLPERPFKVLAFTPNKISLELEPSSQQNEWLYYADSWHPHWKATINGIPTEIKMAYGAFKAVPVPMKRSIVNFQFESYFDRYLFWVFFIASVLFVGGILGFAAMQIWAESGTFQKRGDRLILMPETL